MSLLQRRWNGICAKTMGTDRFWTLCVDHRSAFLALAPLIQRYARGTVLDAGAGGLAWRRMLSAKAERYLATDYCAMHADIDFVSDLTVGIPLPTDSVDLVFCCSVLEHVEDPFAAMSEIARILRPGGHLVLSVPFRYYLHGAPIDYFRFTKPGVELLARRVELDIESVSAAGGLTHEIANTASMLAAILFGETRIAASIVSLASLTLLRMAQLGDRLDREGRFAQNVNAVLRKPGEPMVMSLTQ